MAEHLIVASKLKKLIKDSGMSTSSSALDALTQIVEKETISAIQSAKADKRKRVTDRDFRRPRF